MTASLAVSVEGPTEREFVSNVLKPHLAAKAVFVKPIPISGHASLSSVREDLRNLVASRDYSHGTTLYDLYGFGGREPKQSGEDLARKLHELVGDVPKLIPYVQTYEFEALIFSGPDEAGDVLGNASLPERMRKIVADCGTPEKINDSYDTCPSRRLKALYPAYDKMRHGYRIVERIGLPKVRAGCPRFDAWLTRLESLGRAP